MADALITPTNIREHIETDLTDAALQRLIAAADQEIVETLGEHNPTGTVTETHVGGDKGLFLNRPAASITSITEYRGTTTTVLVAADWRAWYGNRVLERLSLDATNPQGEWAERVDVVYTPVDDDNARIGATIDLVNLAIRYTGLQSERVGDYASTAMHHAKERGHIIARLDRKSLIPG
jgi:hypothetical protein